MATKMTQNKQSEKKERDGVGERGGGGDRKTPHKPTNKPTHKPTHKEDASNANK